MRFVKKRPHRKRGGSSLIISMFFLVVFSALAVSMVSLSDTSVQIVQNHHEANYALASAESGLEVIRYYLSTVSVSGSVSPANRLQTLAGTLQSTLVAAGATNISATYDAASDTISVSSVVLDSQSSQSFTASVGYGGDFDTLELDITGSGGQFTRRIRTNFGFAPTASGAFDFGVASRGPLSLDGNASLTGLNDPTEANVYIESNNENEALVMSGNSEIAGEVSISNPSAYVTLGSSSDVGGQTGQDAADNHVYTGVATIELPVAVTNIFEPYAINIVDSSTTTDGNITFENIKIIEGTNPTFSGNIDINGVVYIESPNHVVFSGNTTITGVVVAEGDADFPEAGDQIEFTGNLSSQGVSQLPAGAAFDGLRDKTGTFILAPGFSLSFSGNFHTINGAIAASGLSFSGNAGGTVTNAVINYSNSEMDLSGNATLRFDRSGAQTNPSGFISDQELEFQPASYLEMPL